MTTPPHTKQQSTPLPVLIALKVRDRANLGLQDLNKYQTPPDDPLAPYFAITEKLACAIITPVLANPIPNTKTQKSIITRLRHLFTGLINDIDSFARELNLSIPSDCPDACQNMVTTPTLAKPAPVLVNQAVNTHTPPVKTFADALVGTCASVLPAPPANPAKPPLPKPHNGPKAKLSRFSARGAKKPTRLIVHCKGWELPFATSTDPTADNITSRYGLIAAALRRQAPNISILGVHRNRTGNLILSFPEGTPRATLMDLAPTFKSCLSISSEVRISFDTPWSTLHLANVVARDTPEGPVQSEEKLAETLLLNPALKALTLTQQPRWIRKPDTITGSRTSAVISFEDADGSIARNLLKTQIFAFGAPVTVKSWLAKPVSSRQGMPPHLGIRSGMDLS